MPRSRVVNLSFRAECERFVGCAECHADRVGDVNAPPGPHYPATSTDAAGFVSRANAAYGTK